METPNYKKEANEARIKILSMIYKGQSSHIGSNFSCIDILTVLFDKARLPQDRILFSKGWVAASAYYFLAKSRIIPKKDLETYCLEGSKYIGLVEPNVDGIEAAGGSMGYGLPFGVGFALANKLQGNTHKTFVLMSDGEMNIGTTWESALLAQQHCNENLRVIVDCNGWQAMGKTKDILDMGDLAQKWRAFGWTVLQIDGHDPGAVKIALEYEDPDSIAPVVILAKTIKGKGVSFMENNNLYHYKNLTEDEYNKALAELL